MGRQPYWRRHVFRAVGRAARIYDMTPPGSRVLVGLSGGKDSCTLLSILSERLRWLPFDYELVACHVSTGYSSSEGIERMAAWCRGLGVVFVLEERETARRAVEDGRGGRPCYLCSRLRKKALFDVAERLDCSRILMAHTMDDALETLFLNVLYGGQLCTLMPRQEFFGGRFVVARPLYFVSAAHTARYAEEAGLPVTRNACPAASDSARAEVERILSDLWRRNGRFKKNVFSSLFRVHPEYLPGLFAPAAEGEDERKQERSSQAEGSEEPPSPDV